MVTLPEWLRSSAPISLAVILGAGLGVAAAVFFWRPAMPPDGPRGTAEASGFDALPGWRDDSHAEILSTFRRSCIFLEERSGGAAMGMAGGSVADWRLVCRTVRELADPVSDEQARVFFETHFRPVAISGDDGPDGLFTGYFEPELSGSKEPGPEYPVPLYGRPPDLVLFDSAVPRDPSARGLKRGRIVDGRARAYFSREEIDRGALEGRVEPILYLRDRVDAFFLHIQGSGRVRLADGGVQRVAFAAKSGQPYTPIGRILVEGNEIEKDRVSMQSIRAWLRSNPDRADAVMWRNRSYIFFRLIDGDPGLGPPGAQGVPLTPGRSLAVDRRFHAYGSLFWLDTTAPSGEDGGEQIFRRLMIAQDTGSAILGAVRGDVFWGAGDRAGEIAGRMKSTGRLHALVPHIVAASRDAAGPRDR